MSLITDMRKQRALYWKKVGTDEYGHPAFDTAVEVKVRWEDQIGEFRNAKGDVTTSKAVVYVDRMMFKGDYLRLLLDDEEVTPTQDAIIGFGMPEGYIPAPAGRYYWDLNVRAQWLK